MVRKLRVEPEGVANSYTQSAFMCPSDSPTTFFKLRIPKNLVPGSIFSKVSVVGDIMGSSLSNIDELLAMPYGCGEQNMLKFAPNIFIMNYLNHTNQVTGAIKNKALDYMRSGKDSIFFSRNTMLSFLLFVLCPCVLDWGDLKKKCFT